MQRLPDLFYSYNGLQLTRHVTYHNILQFSGPYPVAAHVDDIIKTTNDLIVSLLGAVSAVTGEEVTCGWKAVGVRSVEQGISNRNVAFNITF